MLTSSCGNKSSLSPLVQVYVDELGEEDYDSICSLRFPKISRPLLKKLIIFNKRLYEDTMLHRKFAQEGSPWEFNLRDVFRSCEIIEGLIMIHFVLFILLQVVLIIENSAWFLRCIFY